MLTIAQTSWTGKSARRYRHLRGIVVAVNAFPQTNGVSAKSKKQTKKRVKWTSRAKQPKKVFRVLDWIQDSEEVLMRLEGDNVGRWERTAAVLFAETSSFANSQRPRLLRSLSKFIASNRMARDTDTVTAVGSAIRKYAMNMAESDFDQFANFFLPHADKTISSELELELAKGVCWRLLYEPVDLMVPCSVLKKQLVDIARVYSKPRLILKKIYGAIVLNSIMAAILLDAPGTDEVLNEIDKMDVHWFRQLLNRRLRQEHDELPDEKAELKKRLEKYLSPSA